MLPSDGLAAALTTFMMLVTLFLMEQCYNNKEYVPESQYKTETSYGWKHLCPAASGAPVKNCSCQRLDWVST
jgi:hypothetical protein